MATARQLHQEALLDITIAVGGVVSQNAYIKVGQLDSIEFTNNAGFPVDIVFTGTLTNITNLLNGRTSGSQGGNQPLNVTVNYVINNHNTGQQTGGPYAVQFGVGPLTVTITADNPSPDPIAVPAGGTLVFNADANYNIQWSQAGIWSPQPAQVNKGGGPPTNPIMTAQPGANGLNVSYNFSPRALPGRGTVKIGSGG